MNLSKTQIQTHLGAKAPVFCREQSLCAAIQASKTAFCESEAGAPLSYLEFLYQQSLYIRKQWWILQACVLLALWMSLAVTRSCFPLRRFMGVAAPLFAIFILPELWKNRSAGALEIECTACYSLRQIYGARILLFALVDLALLSLFSLCAMGAWKIPAEDLVIQFFLPYLITCCICFRTLYSRKISSEAFAILLCSLWSLIWIELLLHETVYKAISLPLWLAMTAAAALYLGYCIKRGQENCNTIWEVKTQWN